MVPRREWDTLGDWRQNTNLAIGGHSRIEAHDYPQMIRDLERKYREAVAAEGKSDD
jgi:hypothetical protein